MAAAALALAFAAGPAGAADVARGGQLYAIHCAVCHGTDGSPRVPGTPDFRRQETLLRPDMQVVQAIKTGKNMMPGFFGILRDREILDIVAYLRTLN